MKNLVYQQGDVLIYKIDSLPNDLKKVEPKARGVILAEGETHGHFHAIADVKVAQKYECADGRIYLSITKDTILTHEEHKFHAIEAGVYEVGIVQEYDHFAEEARNVAD